MAASTEEVAGKSSILLLDHVNLNAAEWTPELEEFWFGLLGCIRDPRSESVVEMNRAAGGQATGLRWVNIGLQQFHMPLGEPSDSTQNMPNAIVGLSFPDLAVLKSSFAEKGVAFTEDAHDECAVGTGSQFFGPGLNVTSPTGVKLHIHAAASRYEPRGAAEAGVAQPGGVSLGLGMPYVEFKCAPGAAAGIARFYQKLLGATVENACGASRVFIQTGQMLLFCETQEQIPAYDNHHIAIYIGRIETGDECDTFATLYERCKKAGLVWNNPRFPQFNYDTLEKAQHFGEFRVLDLVDPDSGVIVFRLEHEIRSLRHPGCPCKQMLIQKDSDVELPPSKSARCEEALAQ